MPFAALLALAAAADLRVMTFNVRYPNPDDGPDRWEARRELLVETIRAHAPDLLGTQELFYEQGEFIVKSLPEYAWFGVSRRGNREDEHMGVFYRRDRLKLVRSGNFWLSETPEKAGSSAWGMNMPCMVTWGVFEIRGTKQRFHYYNTHFPHRARQDDAARLACAKLILARAGALEGPFILTGDFNAPAGGEVHRLFAGAWQDAWTAAPVRFGPEGTFNGFKGIATGPRIDWIFTRGAIRARQAGTVTMNQQGRYPSDHFPVFAVLRLE